MAQFHERYKGYKVPLTHLRRGLLLKQLRAAGSHFSIELAETVPDKDNTSATSAALVDSETPCNLSEDGEDPESESESESESDEDVQLIPNRRRGRKPKSVDTDEALRGRFLELTDLLPPLPKKGSFNVETIKGSQYFFS
jgi:DNA-directed RNA polymerase